MSLEEKMARADDLVKRLRTDGDSWAQKLFNEAADEIVRLQHKMKFLIEEITDLEGREGMTDAQFVEQIIAMAYREKGNI